MGRPRSPKPSSSSGSSRIGRLAKFCLSLYLLAAIFYTFFHFFLSPTIDLVSSRRHIELDAIVGTSSTQEHGAPAAVKTPGTSAHDLPAGARKHPALEHAGVKAAAIREEDKGDRVWQAAEAAEKRGKKGGAVPEYVRPEELQDGRELVHKRVHGLEGAEWFKDQMHWYHPSSPKAHSGPQSEPSPYDANTSPVAISEDHFLSLSFSSSLQPSKVIPYYYRASAPDQADFNKEDITITTLVTSNRFEVFERLVERYRGVFKTLRS